MSNDYRITTKRLGKMVSEENKDLHISTSAMHYLGCANCDWRGTSMCSYGIGKNQEIKGMGKDWEGICEKRKNVLKIAYRGKSNTPTLKQLQRDYRSFQQETHYNDVSRDYYKLRDDITTLEDWLSVNGDNVVKRDELDKAKSELGLLSKRLSDFGIDLGKLDEKEYDRTSREKSLKEFGDKVSLVDIQRQIVTGTVIDVESGENND
jgi:hypothetical protein